MKSNLFCFLFLTLCFVSCLRKTEKTERPITPVESIEDHSSALQNILDSALLKGTILVFDEQKNTFYSNDFERARTGFLPASTFKIPNSIIALETGIIENEETIIKWNGEDHFMDVWEKDMSFKEAYQLSCVPCYQEIARKIGLNDMQAYLEKLAFGKMEVDSSSLDRFWLTGNSRISPFEQIKFLRNLNNAQLPISKRTGDIMLDIMTLEDNDIYLIRGKTGWSTDNHQNIGWFVAILDINDRTYYLATNVEPKDSFDMKRFGMIRKSISIQAFKSLKIMP